MMSFLIQAVGRSRPACSRSSGRTLVAALTVLLLTVSASAHAQDKAPVPLSRKMPAQNLIAYLQFDGLDAHQAAWQGSASYKILNQTTFGLMLEEVVTKGVDLIGTRSGRRQPVSGEAVVREIKGLAKRGFAVALNGKLPGTPLVTLTFRGGARPETMGLIMQVVQPEGGPPWTSVARNGRMVTLPGPLLGDLALINDKDDLIVCQAANLDATLAMLDGKEPNASTHPLVLELAKVEGAFHPIGFGFLDPKKLPPLPPEAIAAGLGSINRVDYRFGFEQEANLAIFRLLAPSPRPGLVGMFDGSSIEKTRLAPLPSGATHFAIASLARTEIYDRCVALGKQLDPDFAKQHSAFEQATIEKLGVSFRDGVLGKLGPRMSIVPTPGTPGGSPFLAVFLAEVRDVEAFKATLAKVFILANADGPIAEVRNVKTPQATLVGYEILLPPGVVPPAMAGVIKPTLLIGSKFLAFGLTQEAALENLLAVEKPDQIWKPVDQAFAQVIDHLPPSFVALSVGDPRPILPKVVANLPALIAAANQSYPMPGGQLLIPIDLNPANIPDPGAMEARMFPVSTVVTTDAAGITITSRDSLPSLSSPVASGTLVALLLPAVQASREAARRSGCINNMKQMGLAFHNWESTNDRFPAMAIVDKAGKPLLSWRVAILPFLEQNELYNKFKLDEPWDSEHNKPLIKEMPRVFACPTHPAADPSMTFYRVFTGPDTPFDGPEGKRIAGFTDGTSNTLLVVEADEAVPWTKPEGIPFDLKMIQDNALAKEKPQFGASSMHPGGFNALFADGSVRFLKKTINRSVLGALITPASGEVISADSY